MRLAMSGPVGYCSSCTLSRAGSNGAMSCACVRAHVSHLHRSRALPAARSGAGRRARCFVFTRTCIRLCSSLSFMAAADDDGCFCGCCCCYWRSRKPGEEVGGRARCSGSSAASASSRRAAPARGRRATAAVTASGVMSRPFAPVPRPGGARSCASETAGWLADHRVGLAACCRKRYMNAPLFGGQRH